MNGLACSFLVKVHEGGAILTGAAVVSTPDNRGR